MPEIGAGDPSQNSYDLFAYESYPRPGSHPSHMATIAALFGLASAAVEKCKVLEIGCAAGGNILPLAESYPESSFVGIDLSEKQINQGQELARLLGLKNLELRRANIAEWTAGETRFDYIICHGVYSWVNAGVQKKIFEFCTRHLSPAGLLFLSYNTLPGWSVPKMLREMMLFHTADLSAPKEKIGQAIALLEFVSGSRTNYSDSYDFLMKDHLEELKRAEAYYFFHEYLEADNHPCYFHEFAEKAKAGGLEYVGDAHFPLMCLADFPPDSRRLLSDLAEDRVKAEQYIDFLRNRRFRESILCLQGRKVSYPAICSRISNMWISSKPGGEDQIGYLDQNENGTCKVSSSGDLLAQDAFSKTSLACLAEIWPARLQFDELAALAWARSGKKGKPSKADLSVLAGNLLTCLEANLVEVHLHREAYTTHISERPVATALARIQAKRGESVTSLRHHRVRLEPITRQVLSLLDGTHDKTAMLELLGTKNGELHLEVQGEKVTDEAERKLILSTVIDRVLAQLAQHGFLLS